MIGTFQVLLFCRKHGSKLIYAGSSTKFGDNGQGRNQSPYGWSKASNVDLVKNFGKWYGMKYAITYFYNVYGKREISTGKFATLIALFAEKYKKGLPLTVVSPGTQVRNFTHVDDIVSGIIRVGLDGRGDGYGIGSDESFSILEIANMFGGEIEMLPERPGNRMFADLHVEKVKELNWKAKHSIVDFIQEIKQTHKGNLI
jgi:UDP-glucose 4-epimerase